MKTVIITLVLASLAATSAVAKTGKALPAQDGSNSMYHSHALGQQAYPNPDRDFSGPNTLHGE